MKEAGRTTNIYGVEQPGNGAQQIGQPDPLGRHFQDDPVEMDHEAQQGSRSYRHKALAGRQFPKDFRCGACIFGCRLCPAVLRRRSPRSVHGC
jgi:hypothetical protein